MAEHMCAFRATAHVWQARESAYLVLATCSAIGRHRQIEKPGLAPASSAAEGGAV